MDAVVPHTATVLCVDDEVEMLNAYRRALRRFVSSVIVAPNADDGRELLQTHTVDLIILDLRMPGTSGMEFLEEIAARDDAPPVVIATGHGSVDEAVASMKLGAADFIEKPFSPTHLQHRIEPLLRIRELEAENAKLREHDPGDVEIPSIIGDSPQMRDLKATIARLAQTEVTVTITGESGTGKELIAKALHDLGPRRDHPFVVVDCGALPESMIESELFGHRKGAFTGAMESHLGLFRAAHRGTIFLDEIGDLPLAMQTRLLRTLQSREVRPVGSTTPVTVDVRIIAATHIDLREAVRNGQFREDLYYRLTGVLVSAPSLREHRDDIPALVEHLLTDLQTSSGRTVHFNDEAIAAMRTYRWPGNVRELENVVRGALALSDDDEVGPDMLNIPELNIPESPESTNTTLVNAKDAAIDDALRQTGGHRRKAAQLLGVAESTIYRNLKRRGLV